MISQNGKKRILVIDDDIEIRQFLKAALTSEGWGVQEAANGKEALDYLNQNPPGTYSLIFLDMQMPILDGWRFLPLYRQYQQELKNDSKAPVIVMTAAMTISRYANQIQADDYLPKPFDLTNLLSILKKHLSFPYNSLSVTS
ncbi:MAG: response regulator [Chloroflexi bacterium]|nr:response regulator [Chloroflexota bacterium]OJV90171.1 MAG: hypothetical protein BGO39_02060 [Chloroflexi bacterium 54-19]